MLATCIVGIVQCKSAALDLLPRTAMPRAVYKTKALQGVPAVCMHASHAGLLEILQRSTCCLCFTASMMLGAGDGGKDSLCTY